MEIIWIQHSGVGILKKWLRTLWNKRTITSRKLKLLATIAQNNFPNEGIVKHGLTYSDYCNHCHRQSCKNVVFSKTSTETEIEFDSYEETALGKDIKDVEPNEILLTYVGAKIEY